MNNKINIEMSLGDKEILYHLMGPLGQLGIVKLEHLDQYYTINNMDTYDIFKSICEFASNGRNTIEGNDGRTINDVYGGSLFYSKLVGYNGEKNIPEISDFLVRVFGCAYGATSFRTYSILNDKRFLNNEVYKRIIIEIMTGKIQLKDTEPSNYFRLSCSALFNLEVNDILIKELKSITIFTVNTCNIVRMITDIMSDKNKSTEFKDIMKEHLIHLLVELINRDLYKISIIKNSFKFMNGNELTEFLSVIDDVVNYIKDNEFESFNKTDLEKSRKFRKNFNKYTLDRLI